MTLYKLGEIILVSILLAMSMHVDGQVAMVVGVVL